MIDAVYVVFFWILVVEVAIFCFINLPTPRGWKGKLINFLTSSTKMRTFMKIHFGLCLLAGLFFLDLSGTENHFQAEKHKLKNEGHGHMGAGTFPLIFRVENWMAFIFHFESSKKQVHNVYVDLCFIGPKCLHSTALLHVQKKRCLIVRSASNISKSWSCVP